MTTRFTITDDHLLLLKYSRVQWIGKPMLKIGSIDTDFTYDIAEGVGDILGKIPYGKGDMEGQYTADQVDDFVNLYYETRVALQICLSIQMFRTGTYEQPDPDDFNTWIKVEE